MTGVEGLAVVRWAEHGVKMLRPFKAGPASAMPTVRAAAAIGISLAFFRNRQGQIRRQLF